jgi:hypothetical protein
VYGFHLHFWPGQGVPYSMPAGDGNGAATVPWTREWLYLHYEPDVPVFRAYSAEAGHWTAFNEGWVGALVFAPLPPGTKAARLFWPRERPCSLRRSVRYPSTPTGFWY